MSKYFVQSLKFFLFYFQGHHFQSSYAHAHHVMPRMRRKKKTSVSSDDGQLSDEESGARKKSGKRRSSKKEIEHLPTIEDESKPSMVRIFKRNFE